MAKKKKVKPKKKAVKKKKISPTKSSTNVELFEKACKAYGDPMPVVPTLSYVDGEVYPRLNFGKETIWIKIKRFFGYCP
jgi:hypothetical protein